jgi:protein MpaA
MSKVTEISTWATSAKNKPIRLFFSGNFKFKKNLRPLVFIGGVHGDEPEGVRLAEEFLRHFQLQESHYEKSGYAPWILIPCINPDGFASGQRTNGNGVDLNRNYPASNWSPAFDKERYFPGVKAGSEPEIQAIVHLLQEEKPRLVIHFHSWNPCIVATGTTALVDAKRLAKSSGYEVQDNIGYPTPGSLSHYGWVDQKIPVICIEEQEGCDLSAIWPRFEKAFEEILLDTSLREK